MDKDIFLTNSLGNKKAKFNPINLNRLISITVDLVIFK